MALAIVFTLTPCADAADASARMPQIQGEHLRIEFDRTLHSRVVARFDGHDTTVGPFVASESASIAGKNWTEFSLVSQKRDRVNDAVGAGERLIVVGKAGPLTKEVSVTIYDEFPAMAFLDVRYTNTGPVKLAVKGWTNNAYTVNPQRNSRVPAFWSYQGGSYEKRPDWIVPLHAKFRQENFLGMNASDYGGGTPIVDVWRRDVGVAVGHVESRPKLVSLPVSMPDSGHVNIAVNYRHASTLAPGESLTTFRTFVAVHQGDYFGTLADYRRFMMKKPGFQTPATPDSAFGAIWCAWGYGRTMQPKQLLDTLPTVKRLGFAWVTLDDGWQNNVGDWALDPKKFPRGDADMKALVDRIHQEGFRAQLWWSPLSAVPNSELLKDHLDYELLNRDGSARKVSWWNSNYLCPADRRVVEYHKALVRKILVDWGFDGLKLDGQHMNGVPACYNPSHHHERPEASVEALPDFFREIYETAQTVKPGSLVEFCPCGTAYSFFTMPHFNMSVASDPGSSFQVRSKAKTLKALMGDSIPYFGDHVELSDGGDDFASTIGVGELVDEKDFGHAFKIVRSLGLTTRSGRPIPKQSLSFLLRNEFYAGQIVSKTVRVKGNHEPLISEELFQRVRAKLNVGVPHQVEHEDFPLRGTMICMKCRRPLTAGWVKGRGKKYARYWCWTKDCKAYSGSKEEIESDFVLLLGILKPNAEILAQLPMIAARQWESRSESITTESKSLVRRLEEQRSLKLKAIEAKVKGELAESDFEPLKASVEQEITRIEAAMASLDAEKASYADLMSQTRADVLDFAKAWSEGSTRRKREIQKAIFPNGLPFSIRRRKSSDFEPSNVIKGQPFESIFDALRPIGVPDGI